MQVFGSATVRCGGRAEQSVEEHTPCFHCLDTGWFMLTAENDFGELEDYFVLSGASAKRRSEVFGGGTRISRGGVVDALFRRDLELMEVIAAAEDAVVNARVVDLEDAEDWLARAFS